MPMQKAGKGRWVPNVRRSKKRPKSATSTPKYHAPKTLTEIFPENKWGEPVLAFRFKIVVTMYNCKEYIGHCLRSLSQQREPFFAIVVDDHSTDGTFEHAEHTIGDDPRFRLLRRQERYGALANICFAIEKHEPNFEDVIVTVDGDDWLFNPLALTRVRTSYIQNSKLLLTYGQLIYATSRRSNFCYPYSKETIRNKSFRKQPWRASQLRTFKYSLWDRIPEEELINPKTGKHWQMAWDLAMMFPMLELCSEDQLEFIPDVLYVYNDANPLNDKKMNAQLQQDLDAAIRARSIVNPR